MKTSPSSRFAEPTMDNQVAKQLAFYRDHLDIAIETMFAPITLKDQQKVIARAFGRCNELDIVQNRGAGKTWVVGMCVSAMCVLFPGTIVMCCSGTVHQANLILQRIADTAKWNLNLQHEIDGGMFTKPVKITSTGGSCDFKNGSKILTKSISSLRGHRAKILVIDESPEVKLAEHSRIFLPVRNYTREVCITNGIKDYDSKVVKMTSACLKSNDFYEDILKVSRRMGSGDRRAFSIILDHEWASRVGITPASFFEEERLRMPASQFDMEYGSFFLGAEENTLFPYDLTERCRTLKAVEYAQPKSSKSQYVISMDIATSSAPEAAQSVICVQKATERSDGTFWRQLVNMRSYHGKQLDFLANEQRQVTARFPNAVKVVFDEIGLGDPLPQFLDSPWVDPVTGKEHPPWSLDTEAHRGPKNALPILHGFRANPALKQKMVSDMRVALEQGKLQQPLPYRSIRGEDVEFVETMEEKLKSKGEKMVLSMEEQAIFIEADALQIEMGNIVAKASLSGGWVYGTARDSQHDDRYVAQAMANSVISDLEKENVQRRNRGREDAVVGVVSGF